MNFQALVIFVDHSAIPPSFVHVAEVHSSRIQLLTPSDDGGNKKVEKKRKKVRKRSTFTIKQSEDDIIVYNSDEIENSVKSSKDTLSSEDSHKPMIKLRGSSAVSVKERVEMLNMLSRESNVPKSVSDPVFKEPGPVAWRRPVSSKEKRGSATETLSDSSTGGSSKIKLAPLSARHRRPRGSATETLSEDSGNSPEKLSKPPVPLPRKSLTKSSEDIISLQAEVKNADSPKSYCTTSSMDYRDTGVIPPPRQRRHKKKRKLKDTPKSNEKDSDLESKTTERSIVDENKAPSPTPATDDTAVCLSIHGAEPLKMRDFNSKPYLKVHVLDVKECAYRRSAFGKMNIDVLQTHPFDNLYQRTVMPRWDEDLVWMEPISHIASTSTLMLFELFSNDSSDMIAWAFLRPVGVNGATNVGKKLRLQLYKPSRSLPSAAKSSELPKPFFWWQRGKYSVYKSTLFITLNSIPSNFVVKPQELEDLKTQQEDKPKEDNPPEISSHVEEELERVIWSRLPNLSCKLPNKVLKQLPTGPDGGMAIAFNHTGLLLACHTSNTITVFTYKGTRYLTLAGHHGLVYSLSWSPDDKYLLSTSADATGIIWDIANKRTRPFKVFPHPSYVYSACWLELKFIIATGCYDYQVRLWSSASDSGAYPVQHLIHHKARVNTLGALKPHDGPNGNELLVSGDSDGVIIFWKAKSEGSLELSRELKIRELRGKIINSLTIHPAGKRLLIHTRDSLLRMIDIESGSVLQWFQGGMNTKLQTGSTFCGCGSRVIACSEDGSLSIWDGHTGEKTAMYTRLYSPDSPAAVSFHPHEHMMALVSHSSQGFPALTISVFGRDSDGDEVGLVWTEKSMGVHKSQYSLSSSATSRCSAEQRVSDSPEPKSTKKKKKDVGILKSLLWGSKKERKGIGNDAFHDTEIFAPSARKDSSARRTKKESRMAEGDTHMDHRLSDIIKKMDKILVAISPDNPKL
ncbi:jouberin isoform X2 [Cimex lectularius]|uniref:Jouberin n=1 Tax=Cimex lectularius TaxID=79782 RepID=A0A8I6TI11_CIMLE|nr:jouberin isoform X2 [Cimex lectularius]